MPQNGTIRRLRSLSGFLPSVLNRLFQSVIADGAVQNSIADDEKRSAGRAQLSSQLEVALELGFNRWVLGGRGRNVSDPRCCRIGVGSRAAGGVQSIMERAEPARLGRRER